MSKKSYVLQGRKQIVTLDPDSKQGKRDLAWYVKIDSVIGPFKNWILACQWLSLKGKK
jgi:hypothetical protein